MTRDVYYVANIRLPNRRAHGLQLLRMIQAFKEIGVRLTLVVPKKGGGNPFDGDVISHRLKIVRLPVIDIFDDTSLGFNLSAISFMLSSFLYLLMKRLRGERAVIYTIDLDQFSFCLLPLVGWPVFMEMHGSKQNRLPFRFFLKRVCGVVAVGEWTKRRVSEVFGIVDDRIMVFPNGVSDEFVKMDFNRAEARRKLGLPADRKICLYVGRIYDWKGLEILPEAASAIGSLADIYLVGGEAAKFRRLTGRDLPDNLLVIRPAPEAEILEWLAAADVFLLTGTQADPYSYYETSPMKLMEYMAAHRPIIAARTPAVESIVSEREVIFYEPDNGDDLGEKIKQALSAGRGLEEMIKLSFEKAKNLTWSKRAEAIIKFIEVDANSL